MRAYRHAIAIIALGLATGASGALPGPPVLLKAEHLQVRVDPAALKRQFDVLSTMPGVEVSYSTYGSVGSMMGNTRFVVPDGVRKLKVGDSAPGLLDLLGPVLLATGSETLQVTNMFRGSQADRSEIGLQQLIRGVPVYLGRVVIEYDEDSGRIQRMVASFLPDRGLPGAAVVNAEDAWRAVVHGLEASGDALPGSVQQIEKPSLAYLVFPSDPARVYLAWGMQVAWECPTGRRAPERAWIDAVDKTFIAHMSVLTDESPGPCQSPATMAVECEAEPDPSLANGPYSPSSSPDASKPRLVVTRIGCTNRFHLSWPRAPGATIYNVQRAPPDPGWAFARTVADGNVLQCTTRIDAPTLLRMRTCNGCCCGPWSDVQTADPTAKCP